MMPTAASRGQQLDLLLKEANYDGALELVRTWDVSEVIRDAHDPVPQLKRRCLLSEILDYGGLLEDAFHVIREDGERAVKRLASIRCKKDMFDRLDFKQDCWALLASGMCLYRRSYEDYTEALKRFEIAKTVLLILKNDCLMSCTGSIARAWYCIGLVHRQRHAYREARKAFTKSIELTGIGIDVRQQRREPTASFDYHMARCYGLGIAWIAYDEALLDEAKTTLVAARRLLVRKSAKFISAYVDVVHASVLMSGESMRLDRIDEAIRVLTKAYRVLSPSGRYRAYVLCPPGRKRVSTRLPSSRSPSAAS